MRLWSARARERREHALELETVAELAHRRCGGVLATAEGRAGPGVEARALADPLLAGVREDFVAEPALSRDGRGRREALVSRLTRASSRGVSDGV